MDQSNLMVLMEKNYNLAIMNTITMLLINSFFFIIETFVPPHLSFVDYFVYTFEIFQLFFKYVISFFVHFSSIDKVVLCILLIESTNI
jgi:hypothetical protein